MHAVYLCLRRLRRAFVLTSNYKSKEIEGENSLRTHSFDIRPPDFFIIVPLDLRVPYWQAALNSLYSFVFIAQCAQVSVHTLTQNIP